MNFHRYLAGVAIAAILAAPDANAQKAAPASPQDLASLRHDLDAMRQDYQTKIDDLSKRLAAAEADASAAHKEADTAAQKLAAANASPAPEPTPAPEPLPPPQTTSASQNAFNPGIAAVLNGFFLASSHDPTTTAVPGFPTGGDIGNPPRGFSLGESEVSFAANIDPSVAGFLDFSIQDNNDVSLEEAYIRTTNLPGGFTLKAGRFLSGIGYINERHAHDWSFSDAPLPYKAFLNNQFGDDGVQVRWIAPTAQYLELGAEAFRGDEFPAGGASNDGVGAYTAFARTGSDINIESSYLVALSYFHSRDEGRATSNPTGTDLFTGDTDLGIASLVYKWAPKGNPTVRNLMLTSELFYGREKGDFDLHPMSQTHFGWYAQGVYQFMPSWSAGVRLAGLDSQTPTLALAGTPLNDFGHTPFSASALLEFDTSEFGRWRLQYTEDDTNARANHELLLQYTVIYGPHGAHRY